MSKPARHDKKKSLRVLFERSGGIVNDTRRKDPLLTVEAGVLVPRSPQGPTLGFEGHAPRRACHIDTPQECGESSRTM